MAEAKLVETKYTITRRHPFTFEDIKELLRKAHEHCKKTVPAKPHRVGKAKRLVISPPRGDYLKCIRDYIYAEIEKKIGAPVPPR